MDFDPIDHLICTMTNKRKTTLQEITNVTKQNPKVLLTLINYGISQNILNKIKERSDTFYTLTPHGEQQLAMMSSKIIEGWKMIKNAVETKNIDIFVKMVKENEEWIKYLRYARIVTKEDADFILKSYKEIIKSREKKKKVDSKLYKLQTDAEIKRTNALTKQQWEFDDQNYEITREYNNYVDTNYYDNSY